MREGNLLALGTQFVHRCMQVTIGAAEAHDEQLGIVFVAKHLEVGHGDGSYLSLTLAGHQVVILGIRTDGTRLVVLLEAAEDVLEAFSARHSPVANALGITHVWCPRTFQILWDIRRRDGGILAEVGQFECCGTICNVGIRHENYGCHVFQRHLRGRKSHFEAVGGACCGNDWHWALAITTKESLQEVGLFALRWKTRRRSASLHVEHNDGQFHDDCKVHRLTLEADAGAGCARYGECSSERSAYCRRAACYLVLALNGNHAEALVLRELVKDVGSGCDGIRSEVELQPSLLGSGDEAIRCGLVAGDVHVATGHFVLGLDAIDICHAGVRVVSVIVACLNDFDVRLGHFGLLGELLTQEAEGNVEVSVEQPAHQSERKHIATFAHALGVHPAVGEAILHHRREWAGDYSVRVDAHLAEIIGGLELCLLQVFRSEAVGIDDDSGIGLSVAILRLECCGIHCHEDIAEVARRIDLSGTDVDLETADTRERTLRSADVGRVVRERTDTVAHGGGHSRKNISGELHAVAGITREPYYYRFFFLYFHIFL